MNPHNTRGYIVSFFLSRLGVVIGLIIFIASSFTYLFIPQAVPISIKLSSFEKIILSPENGDCSSISSLVEGNGFAGIPPLHITNRLTIIPRFGLYAEDKVFPFRINLHSVTAKISLVKDNQLKEIGEYKISDGEYTGSAKAVSADFSPYELINQSIYYCDSSVTIPGDYLLLPISTRATLIQSYIGGKNTAFISISGDVEISQLDVHEPYDEIVFSLEPFPMSELSSVFESSFSVYADKLSLSSQFPYAVSDVEWNSSLPKHSVEATTDAIEIYSPTGVMKINNSNEIQISTPTQNSTQLIKLSPSILNKISDLSIETNSETGELEIFGTTTSIRFNNQEMGIIIWNKLPDYVQTGIVGLIITLLSGIAANGKKVIVFFKPYSFPFSNGEFVCDTRSGYIIAGKLIRKPSKSFPFFELKQARRRLRTSNEWDKIQTIKFRVSASDVEQYYEVNEELD